MAELICKVDKRLVIPPKFKGFPNEEELVIDFIAGEPKEVPKYVAEYWTKNYPHIYKDTGKPEPKKSVLVTEEKEEKEKEFDPMEWLEINYTNAREGLVSLGSEKGGYQKIQKVASAMRLKPVGKSKKDLIDIIVHDIAVKEKQQEELDKHKEAI